MIRRDYIKLAIVYIALIGVFLSMCACMGCASSAPLSFGSGYTQYRLPACEVCGSTKKVEGCHIYPQIDYPDLRDKKANLVTLCRPCHMCLSHFQNTSRYWNPNLREIVDVMINSKRTYKKYEVKDE